MKIILLKDIQSLGEEGDIIEVKNGYAANYLLPNKVAVLYNNQNFSLLKSKLASIKKRKEEKKAESKTNKEKLDNHSLNIFMQSGDRGRLYGSLTTLIIAEKVKEDLGIDLIRKQIEIPKNHIKSIGTYRLKIKLYENDFATLKVNIRAIEKNSKTEEVNTEEIKETKIESPENK